MLFLAINLWYSPFYDHRNYGYRDCKAKDAARREEPNRIECIKLIDNLRLTCAARIDARFAWTANLNHRDHPIENISINQIPRSVCTAVCVRVCMC